jgi:hypothetical protein
MGCAADVRCGANPFTSALKEAQAMMSRIGLVTALCVPLLAAAQNAPRIRDSAGVTIVENSARLGAPIRFALGAAAVLDVGGLDDNAANEFNHRQGYLRGVLLSNGDLAVIDVNRVHFFDRTGKRKLITGRDGSGPGEFRYLTSICRTRGDTILVSDNRNRRLTVLDRNGSVVRSIAAADIGSPPFDACLDDGTFILQKSQFVQNGPSTVRAARYALDGTMVDSVGTFDFGVFDMATQREAQLFAARSSIVFARGFGEVEIRSLAGKRVTIVRSADAAKPISDAEREERWKGTIPRNTPPDEVKQRMDRMRSMPTDKTWPAHGRAHVDLDGRLWIQDYRQSARVEHAWTAFDSSGKLIGRLVIPATTKRFEVIGFGRNQLLVARTDEDDALHFTVYPITMTNGR